MKNTFLRHATDYSRIMVKRIHLFIPVLFFSTFFLNSVQAQTSSIESDVLSTLPEAFEVSPAYPNPFNPRTSFSLTVGDNQEITITVYNVLGIQVQRLFTGMMEAGETKTFTIEAGDLPSGIYLYHVKGKNISVTRQITLLK